MLFNRTSKPTDADSAVEDPLDGWSRQEAFDFQRLSTILEMKPGRQICAQDSRGAEAFLILRGEAEVIRDGEVIATVGPGEFVGEMALMAGSPRNASVVASTPLRVAALSRREFRSVMASLPTASRSATQNFIAHGGGQALAK